MVSVIMGIRNWQVDRLALAVRAHMRCSVADQVEVVVVDYGSEDPQRIRDAVEGEGGRVFRADVTGRWNRAAALNLGIRQAARGDYLLTTDADILFAPKTIETVLATAAAANHPKGVYALVQCRDLPEHLPVPSLQDLPWKRMEEESTLRPQWGMGGCACFSRSFIEEVRGYDERLEWWGGEDNDLGRRAQHFGLDVRWVEHPDARIYHIAHERALDVNKGDKAFHAVWARNREIAKSGRPVYRNFSHWGGKPSPPPPVSVVVITRNRARLLRETIDSILKQTFENFELLVVDDGSEDDTRQTAEGVGDPRIRYIRLDHGGIPRARNVGVRESRGEFVCIHDDDDLMLPNRIESQLKAASADAAGSYGGWIDCQESTGELDYQPGRARSLATLLFATQTMIHPASMFRRDVLLQFPYNESYPFGSDYDMNLRVMEAGHRLNHTGDYLILRRIHGGNVTVTDGQSQRVVGRQAYERIVARLGAAEQSSLRDEAKASRPVPIAAEPTPDYLWSLFPNLPPLKRRAPAAAGGANGAAAARTPGATSPRGQASLAAGGGKPAGATTRPAPAVAACADPLGEILRRVTPSRTRVLVVSKGDEQLVTLKGRSGGHFPQTAEGLYAGYHPGSSREAIDHLEQLRGKGADFLVFPNSSFWWLAHYEEFRLHLNRQYLVAWKDSRWIVYDLRGTTGVKRTSDHVARWSPEGKAGLVLRLLRGETLDAVSEDSQVPTHEIEQWKHLFIEAGTRGLKRLDGPRTQAPKPTTKARARRARAGVRA